MNRMSVLAAVLLAVASPAWAHAFLKTASPAVGSTVGKPPATVTIEFTEGVEPRFSTIAVTNAAGMPMTTGVHLAPDGNTRLVAELKPLTPGRYDVVWHATAVDTHKTEGRFGFTVQP